MIEKYVHPHIASLATAVVEDFKAAGKELLGLNPRVSRRAAVPAWLEPAIAAYEKTALQNDPPMLKTLERLGSV